VDRRAEQVQAKNVYIIVPPRQAARTIMTAESGSRPYTRKQNERRHGRRSFPFQP